MNIKDLQENWDLIIVGGGVTGAGILREAVRMDLRVLLLEQRDFAWGTSSRSSKLIHGGLRYLRQGRFLLTRDAVSERTRLLKEAPGLIDPLGFLMPIYTDHGPGKWLIRAGLCIYDLMARSWQHRFCHADEVSSLMPHIRQENLMGGFRFSDAQVDDARLVLRLIREAVSQGAHALNYTSVIEIMRDIRGNVVAVTAEDTETGAVREFSARAVINAAGAWAEKLHPSPKPGLHLRPLRGSHLIFPSRILPVTDAVSVVHPKDRRPVFVIPWEGATLFGTTDLDHAKDLSEEPSITQEEAAYLTDALHFLFPSLNISVKDALSSFAGVRPVLSRGKTAPSKESREHVVWIDKGLVTITGGKLTTFRKLAWDALKAAMPFLPPVHKKGKGEPVFSSVCEDSDLNYSLSSPIWQRLFGRYGKAAYEVVRMAGPDDLAPIPGTHTLWAELPFAAKHEQVRHLDDLLLRRVRMGLLTPCGGEAHLGRIREMCSPLLSWDEKRWEEEIKRYFELWEMAYGISPAR